MQTTDTLYNTILGRNHAVQYKVDIAGHSYFQNDELISIEEANALFDKFSIGNANAGTLNIKFIPYGTIPQMALVEVYFRLHSGALNSNWYPKGKYFIDTRETSHDGIMTLECFDAMLKAEYTFMESGSWTSTTALATVQMIAGDMGVSIESGTTTLLTNDSKIVPNVPLIGEDGTTGREMLQYIAAMYGGNFIIDEAGNLKLVQLTTPAATIDVGVLATSLDTAPAFDPIDRVILKGLDEETGFRSPEATFDQLTGRILEAKCPWTSQTLADDLLAIVNGYTYQPFSALGVNIDPAMQLGDGITINGTTSAIYSSVLHFDARCAADLSAPYEEEVNHEYPYRSPAQRMVTKQDLKTAGQTIINGSNIKTGTITLGGDNNGNGQMIIVDANNVPIGKWDNSRLTIFDDTASDAVLDNAKFAILRTGASEDSEFGLFEGATQVWNAFFPGDYPNEVVPFIWMQGTRDGTTIGGQTLIFPSAINFGNGTAMTETPNAVTSNVITRTGGKTIGSQSLFTWGRIAHIELVLGGDNTARAVGSNIFTGTISSDYKPKADVMGVGFWDSAIYVGWLKKDGSIVIRLSGYASSYTINTNAVISWTYLF